MSGIVAQRIATPTSLLEVDDFTALACYEDPVEDEEQTYDEDDEQVVEVFEDDGSEDGREREEEYVEDADNEYEYCEVNDGVSESSVYEEEATNAADDVDNDIGYDIAADEEICVSENVDEAEVIVLQSSNNSSETFGNTSVDSSMYCCVNSTVSDYIDGHYQLPVCVTIQV